MVQQHTQTRQRPFLALAATKPSSYVGDSKRHVRKPPLATVDNTTLANFLSTC